MDVVASVSPTAELSKEVGTGAATRIFLRVAPLALLILLAATSPRNSDLWLHLAAGRNRIEEPGSFVKSPTLFTANEPAAVQPSWLVDMLFYGLFVAGGGFALMLCKTLIIALTGALLICRTRGHPWLGLLLISCGAVAMGPWLALRPILASYFFLALILVLLDRGLESAFTWRASWPLAAACALWANSDEWFLLGPLVIALTVAGQRLDAARAPANRAPWLLPLGCLAACLLTPYHFHAFRLPMTLGFFEAFSPLQDDPLFQEIAVGFWRLGLTSPGTWCSAVLAVGGVMLVFFNRGPSAWARKLPLLALLLLSLVQMRAIPFYVIAAVPELIRALGPWAQSRQIAWLANGAPTRFGLLRSGRFVTLLAALALGLLAWPGWLQPRPFEPRSWTAPEFHSLAKAGATIAQWRQQSLLHEEQRGLNLSPDVANILSWTAPREPSFFNSQLELLPADAAEDLVTLRRWFTSAATPREGALGRDILRRWGIAHVILHQTDLKQNPAALMRLFQQSEEWPVLFLDGPTVIFGWRDPEHRDASLARRRLNLTAHALQPAVDERAPMAAPAALPIPTPWWWEAFTYRPGVATPKQNEANLHRWQFEALRPEWNATLHRVVQTQMAGKLILLGVQPGHPFELGTRLATSEVSLLIKAPQAAAPPAGPGWAMAAQAGRYAMTQLDAAPPEHLLLALRAARRGLQADARDAACWLELAQAYRLLLHATRESVLASPRFLQFRQLQMIAAYRQAILLRPQLVDAHAALVALCREGNFLDLALEHQDAVVRAEKRRGPRSGESASKFKDRLETIIQDGAALQRQLNDRRRQWTKTSAQLSVGERAQQAYRYGLPLQALDLLLNNDVAAFGAQGLELEIELLLLTGRLHDARVWLAPDHEQLLGSNTYRLLNAKIAAVIGDYETALDQLDDLAMMTIDLPQLAQKELPIRTGMGLLVGHTLLNEASLAPLLLTPRGAAALNQIRVFAEPLSLEADITALAGMLALEAGHPRAPALLRKALSYAHLLGERVVAGADFPLRRYAERWVRAFPVD
jgi:hypothetical protein